MCRAHAAGQGGLTSESLKRVGGKDVLVSVLSHKPRAQVALVEWGGPLACSTRKTRLRHAHQQD